MGEPLHDVSAATPPTPPTLQERVSGAILEAAARVLAAEGQGASISDVAAAAGVARATIYRYFATRAVLLEQLAGLAVARAGERLASARVDQVGAAEGVARAVRALLDVGDLFVVLARERVRPDPESYDRLLMAPLRRLVERGQAGGELRADVPASWLSESLLGLVVAILSARPLQGREDTVAAIASLFLEGTRVQTSTVTSTDRPH
jgi:TetR/AcrR family transcriptional regulator, mexCD-oprJ operon repressor